MELNGATILLYLLTLALFSAVNANKTLCPRIFFQNIDEDYMPYKIIEGVYVKQNYIHEGFPVYKRENDNLLFYLKTLANGQFSLLFGLTVNDYFGVKSNLYSFTNPSVWLASGTLNKDDVFGGLISYWSYRNYRDTTNYRVTTPPIIKAICVDEDVRECSSDRVYLNSNFTDGSGNVINDTNTDYFERQAGNFRNLRPVYKHSTQNWYLVYTSDNYWLVTSTRYPSNYNDRAFMRVRDFAQRPEYISNTWSIHYNGWRQESSLRIKCRGIRSQANTCSTSPCSNGASCVYTSGNETLCLCPTGYYGLRCTNTKKCPYPPRGYPDTEFGYTYRGRLPGDLAMTYCRGSYPSVRFAICDDNITNPYWRREGTVCRPSPPTQSSPQQPSTPSKSSNSSKPFNTFNDVSGLTAAVLTCAILLQILLPFVLWCCAYCKKSCKEVDEAQQDAQRREQQFMGELETRIENGRRSQSQDELDQSVQNCRHAMDSYETEASQLKRTGKGVYRKALLSIFRLISMDLNISFYLWLIYYIGCTASECTKYGDIFNHLQKMATVMLVLCPLVVLIESICSHELSYIKNIMHNKTAWNYIQRMHAVAPVISTTVKCYHWGRRSRDVNSTERYNKRFVTFVDTDDFKFGSWVDVSKKEMPTISSEALTRLKIKPYVIFGDRETDQDFDRQKKEMLDRNRHRDDHMHFSENRHIPVFEKRISAYVDLKVRPWWIGQGYYWLATLLMLTWPYRWLFRAKTAKSYYDMKKKIYKSETPLPEVDQANMGRVNPSFSDMTEEPSLFPPSYNEVIGQ